MNWKQLISKQTLNTLSRFKPRSLHPLPNYAAAPVLPFISSRTVWDGSLLQNPKYSKPHIHSTQRNMSSKPNLSPDLESADSSDAEDEDDGTMNEFLSRFVWIMRGKLAEAYPDCDKQTIDGMLLIIVGKVVSEMEKGGLEQMLGAAAATLSGDFSEDLWRAVWEVSNSVLEDMKKEQKKEKMKGFLQSEEVQEMCRFAGEVGIRGDLLRELRFKWAREKMEEGDFYDGLERLRKEEKALENEEAQGTNADTVGIESEVVSLPKRRGKIRYKIYGLHLSDKKWAEVVDRIHERGEVIWPQEPKAISGKCKLVTEKILSMNDEDDPSALLAEWVKLLQPNRVDWISLLDKLKERNTNSYFKVSELLLSENSFQPNIRDYSTLVEAHAKENRLEDAERILKKMTEIGIVPDILTSSVLVHMYGKAGNLDRAKEAFEILRSHGFQPDVNIYNSMIKAYVNAGQPKLGESLMREMEARDIKPTKDIYMALLRSFAQRGDVGGAGRIATTMQFAGFGPSLESCTLLVEAHGQAGDTDQARSNFDFMLGSGYKPDDKCIASMIAAYEKKNLLDKALNLLLQLEKDGFELGPATSAVLIDWLGKLQLVDEAEQLSSKVAELGEGPPLKIQVSLCDMYARARIEKKTLQALGVLEAKKDQLGPDEFERVIKGLMDGGFLQDARRVHGLMEAHGFAASEGLKISLMAKFSS